MKILNLLVSGHPGGIETLCNNIDKYSSDDNYWVFLFDGGEITNEMISRNKNNVFVLDCKKNLFKILKQIKKIINEKQIDIINIHHGGLYCNFIYCLLNFKYKKVRFVRTLHSCYEKEKGVKSRIYDIFLHKALKNSDLIICVSEAVKRTHIDRFKNICNDIVVVYNGIPNCFYNNVQLNKNYNSILYIGRLESYKGVHLLLEAFSIICKKYSNIKLDIVGHGSKSEELKKLSKKLNINDKVTFWGARTDIINFLDNSGIFVYPSTWEEAFGISVIEAMARGSICITFKRGGLVEIIQNGNNGFLVDDVDSCILADQLEEVIMMSDENKRNISKNAIKSSKRFKIKNTINDMSIEYKKILNIHK